jgi:hypothetical protein
MLTSSMLAVLIFAGWWWVTWPERTARKFVELLGAGKKLRQPNSCFAARDRSEDLI